MLKMKKFKNEIKVQKVHKIYQDIQIDVKVNFEAQSSIVCIFFFFLQNLLHNQN